MGRHSGNRLAVPRQVRSKHLFYKTTSPSCDRASLNKLAQYAIPRLRQRAIGDTIEVIGRECLVAESGDAAGGAWDEVVTALPSFVRDVHGTPEVLACEWAAPHVDDHFVGFAYYSIVLHTGTFPYRMQTLHTAGWRSDRDALTEVVSSVRTLRVGDAFVFDPTTPHFVVPERPHQDELLVLLQVQIEDSDEDDRATLLSGLPPLKDDCDESKLRKVVLLA